MAEEAAAAAQAAQASHAAAHAAAQEAARATAAVQPSIEAAEAAAAPAAAAAEVLSTHARRVQTAPLRKHMARLESVIEETVGVIGRSRERDRLAELNKEVRALAFDCVRCGF